MDFNLANTWYKILAVQEEEMCRAECDYEW
jgi:hypothetical protein